MVYPVLVGGGIPFFRRRERRVDLAVVETRTFDSRVVYLRAGPGSVLAAGILPTPSEVRGDG